VNHWLNAEIIGVRNDMVRVHYTGWSPKFDEWVEISSDRILKQWQRGMNFQLNHRIDVLDERDTWREAKIIEMKGDHINIHYYGFSKKYDEWIHKESDRIAEVGSHSKAFGAAKFHENHKKYAQRRKFMQLLIDEENFKKKLYDKGMVIKEVGGDGNCLFRSFADQLYGRDEYHQSIREICMDYIANEHAFFKNFVVGGEEKFDEYIERKRQDAVWGDDVEIQALSEIYNRSIEIYAYSNEPMRTFHEAGLNKEEPIRISYHGSSHYNSIKKLGKEHLLGTPFGQIEDFALRNSKMRTEKARDLQENNIMINTDHPDTVTSEIINRSRLEFENKGKRDMEAALEESLALYEQEMLNKIQTGEEDIEQTIKMSLDNKDEEELIKMVMTESKLEQEKENDTLLKMALDESKRETSDFDDPMLNPTIKQVVLLGFPLEMVIQAYSVFGDDPNAIVNFISESYGF